MTGQPSFDTGALALEIEALPAETLHDLPYGVIRLSADGTVMFYSRSEAALSGYGSRPTLGKQFFADIAPCFSTSDFQGRIDRAAATGVLDIEFGTIGDFNSATKELRVRVQSASSGGYWIFMQRL